jgi:tRNA A37 threonylcarbamoyltransferase TsaD
MLEKLELEGCFFPRVWLVKREFNFSFSGLKSSVKREIDKRKLEK